MSTSVIIDACVARSSGAAAATHPTSKHCRSFLEHIFKLQVKCTFTGDLEAEWKDHASNFALKWKASMRARRLIDDKNQSPPPRVWRKLKKIRCDAGVRALMKKDSHLIDASIHTKSPIFSLDDAARLAFSIHHVGLNIYNGVRWVNPDVEYAEAMRWVGAGFPHEVEKLLISYSIGVGQVGRRRSR